MKRISCAFGTGLVGLFLFLLGVGLALFGTRNIISTWAWEKLTLKNGSEAMATWVRPPRPITLKIYLFNVTNSDAVSEGAFPVLTEIGPYVYEQTREKVNIIPLENYTLSFQLRNDIHFKQSLSGGLTESDLVTIINVPLAGTILSVYESIPELVGVLDEIWPLFYPGQKNIFMTTTVKNLLFDGITIDCTSKKPEVYFTCRGLGSRKSSSIRKDGKNLKFSFFYSRNGTSAETYQVDQGVLDLRKSAQYTGINFSPSVNTWNDQYCDMINGSDGAQFPAMLNKMQKLYIFEKELCRSVYSEFEEEINRQGVTLFKYTNTKFLLASAEENPDNGCFCRSPMSLGDLVEEEEGNNLMGKRGDTKKCFENGVLPLMPCVENSERLNSTEKIIYDPIRKLGFVPKYSWWMPRNRGEPFLDRMIIGDEKWISRAPIVASFPHFYLGDQSYINYSGLNPVKYLHETFVEVEPVSGVAVLGFKRIQFNLEVKRIFEVGITSNLVEGLFPILWIEEGMELPEELFKHLKYALIEKEILEIGTSVLIGLGLFLMIASYFIPFLLKKTIWRESSREHFLTAVDSNNLQGSTSDTHSQGLRPRVGFVQYSKPTDLAKMKTSKMNEFQRNFLIDNFFP